MTTPYLRVKKVAHEARESVRDFAYRSRQRVVPYSFHLERYQGEFILNTSGPDPSRPQGLERKIYSFWTGDNDLTPNRKRGWDSLKRLNPDLEVVLVTPDNLANFLLPDHPLHPSYHHLSLVHRSDYLRCYFMHFHGGGYADVKTYDHSWSSTFEILKTAPHIYAAGYREVSSEKAATLPGNLGRDIKLNYSILIACGAFIMRPNSPMTAEWYEELQRRMDSHSGALSEHPGDMRGSNPGYPIRWTGILGDIVQPLFLKYHQHLHIDDRLRPRLKNYH